jgi:multidrug resistance protein MdtO
MQMAFAFFLGVLHDYGPTMELTTARDRIVGILLGNVLMTIVFSTMWPVSAFDRARQVLAQAFVALGELVRNATQSLQDARLTAVQKVVQARHLISVAEFETHLLQRDYRRESFEETAARSLDRLAAAAFVVAAQPVRNEIGEAARMQDAAAAQWFADMSRLIAARDAPSQPPARSNALAQTDFSPATSSSLRAAIYARTLLQREIEHVTSIRV